MLLAAGGLLAASFLIPAFAADAFLATMRKAEGRREPEERIEYFSRAIRAWSSDHGTALLANCHFRRGQAYFDELDLERAEPDFSKTLDLDPSNAIAYGLRGRIHLRAGRHGKAERDFAEAAALGRGGLEAQLRLGEAQLRGGRTQEALKTFDAIARAEPIEPRAQLGAARAFMARKRWPEALKRLDKALELSRDRSAEAFTERAVAKVALNQRDEALADYDSAIPLHESRLEELENGKAKLDALEQRERTARAFYGRGRLLEYLAKDSALETAEKQREKALSDFTAACELNHPQACKRRQALAGRPKATAPEKPKKRRGADPDEDPGDRIYAN